MKRRKIFYGWQGWLGLVGLLIGAGVLAFSFWFLSSTVVKDINYVNVEATVVDIADVRVYRDGRYVRVYAEVLEFKADKTVPPRFRPKA